MAKQKEPQQIDANGFCRLLEERFPDVWAKVDSSWHDLIHLVVGEFGRATQSAIDGQQRDVVRKHFLFMDEAFRDGNPELQNAIAVSYLEHLRFEGRKASKTNAGELLTPRLQHVLADLEAYLRELVARQRKA